MSRLFVHGLGAVSPAGWGVSALRAALAQHQPLTTQSLARPGWKTPLLTRAVPPPSARLMFQTHPRLRRTSMITQHLVAAAVEALGEDVPRIQAGKLRLGIVVCLMAGCVAYSRRFFEEVLQSPATASPMIFPETVFNAPASHLAAFLNSPSPCYTMVGDDAGYLSGLAVAAGWLQQGIVDACLVIAAEETDWIVADAIRHFSRQLIHANGAGALYLSAANRSRVLAELITITDAFSFTANQNPAVAARRMRQQLRSVASANELLVESSRGVPEMDQPELAAWADWAGARQSPRRLLGEGFPAAAAWQCIAAVDPLGQGEFTAANVSVVGVNQQSVGARFVALKESTS